jgi:trehalose 6-phosphate synthase
MAALHRLADFCIVSSLHDGMNLVAKEFVASRFDEDGVLVLSQFAGSALELSDAVLFNPYAIDELTDAIRQAITMSPAERKRRMQRMRTAVEENNVFRWAGKILSALLKVDTGEAVDPAQASAPHFLGYSHEHSSGHSAGPRTQVTDQASTPSAL